MIEEALILWTEHALLIYSIFWILKLTTTLPGFLLLCTFKNIWIIDYLTCLGAIEWPSKLVRLHSTYVRSNFIFADFFYFWALSDFWNDFLNYVTARKKMPIGLDDSTSWMNFITKPTHHSLILSLELQRKCFRWQMCILLMRHYFLASFYSTVWKFQSFSAIQILCEIKRTSESPKLISRKI